MSRRVANPPADRAAQNQNTIKNLLKLEGNKTCADCKRNKHPRWASWNLGIFVCIRCSGIHRGMGTHISRVKSVDLDAWTDEQLQSVLRWGNARANKYWEAKLAPGHVPSEAKIENFIRTKYDSKRWVMDGPMPDPSTLDVDGDDDVPLNLVQEKAKLERSTSQRVVSTHNQAIAPVRRQQNVDLFGDDTPSPPVRPSTTDVPGTRPPPRGQVQPPLKQTKPADSLLGLDFFGDPQPGATNRPSSAISNPLTSTGPSRPDLKQSILSLYASAPKPQQQPQPQSSDHGRTPSFGGGMAPTQPQQPSFVGLNDAFSGLSFSSSTSPPPPHPQSQKPSPFANLTGFSSAKSPPAASQMSSPPLSGGGFFDTPKSAPPQAPRAAPKPSNGLNFSFTQNAAPAVPITSSTFNSSAGADLFDLSPSPAPPPPHSSKVPSPPPPSHTDEPTLTSAFNLSAQPPKPTVSSRPPITATTTTSMCSSNIDAWGSTDAWSTPDAPSQPVSHTQTNPRAPSVASPPITRTSNDFGAWGATAVNTVTKPPATVSTDEDFGGWNSAGPISPVISHTTTNTMNTSSTGFTMAMPSNPMPGMQFGVGQSQSQNQTQQPNSAKKTGTGFGGDDLFSNVWE